MKKKQKIEQELRTCELNGCKETFFVYPNTKIKKRFCSRKCQVEWQKTSQLGEKNGNFGNRKPNMFKHTEEAKRIIREKVTNSWKDSERLKKQIEGINRHRLPNGSLDWITPESRENISKKNIERLLNNCENFAYVNCKKGYYFNKKNGQNEFHHSSWELNRMTELDLDDNVIYWTKNHKIIIKYPHDEITKRYYPDFYIEFKDGTKRIEEIKGYVRPRDIEQLKLKIIYSKIYCKSFGYEFVIDFKKNKKLYKDIIKWEKLN